MTKIEWDAIGERYFENGTDRGVLFPQDETGNYKAGVAWNGLTGLTESPSGGDPTDLWADNMKYATMRGAEKFSGTIEAYTYPDEFAECDGSAEPATGVVIGGQKRKAFGLAYRTNVSNDVAIDAYKIHLVYGCTASPSERAYTTTNDSPDAITFSWEFESTPVNVTDYKPTAVLTIESHKADKDKLAELEAILYGSEGTESRLPLPDEVIELFDKETVDDSETQNLEDVQG